MHFPTSFLAANLMLSYMSVACLETAQQTNADPRFRAEVVPVCSALRDRVAFHGKLVAIRGILRSTPEGASLVGHGCDSEVNTNGLVWKAAINLSITDTGWPGWSESRNTARMKALWSEVQKSKPRKNDRVWVTYYGRFETFTDLESRAYRTPDGKPQFRGFGHLGVFPAQLLAIDGWDVTVQKANR